MIWPAEDLWQNLVMLLPGLTIEVLPEIDSSNSELMRRARAGQIDPVLLVAESQTAGRGRLGRTWHSRAGDTLTFSLGLNLAPVDWSGLSLAVGLSLARSLDPMSTQGVRLKWPNDVWVARPGSAMGWSKLAGILIETAVPAGAAAHEPRYCVIGIGINIAAPQPEGLTTEPLGWQDLQPGASAPAVLRQLAGPLLRDVQAFERQGFAPLQQAFNDRDALRDLSVQLSDGRTGRALGVNASGALQVQTAQGLEVITSAEVSVRPQSLSSQT